MRKKNLFEINLDRIDEVCAKKITVIESQLSIGSQLFYRIFVMPKTMTVMVQKTLSAIKNGVILH